LNKIDLSGRCAVVTGGAQGFGRGIAERFVASGAKVAIWDNDRDLADETARSMGSSASSYRVDVSESVEVEAATTDTIAAFGRIDILVNNAGVAGAVKPVWETDLAEWRRVMRINLDGPFICCRAIVPIMIRQAYGRIVNVGSVAGKEGNPNSGHYSASKAGLIGLTKSLGKELGDRDIAVNVVTPGIAKTAILDQMPQDRIEMLLSKIPRGRFVEMHDLASMVAWMSSEECAFTTGAVFDLSGGRSTY
jgi:2-dehydro-3-deoxy-L-rhamnonate dehydrogenase (NAD+)